MMRLRHATLGMITCLVTSAGCRPHEAQAVPTEVSTLVSIEAPCPEESWQFDENAEPGFGFLPGDFVVFERDEHELLVHKIEIAALHLDLPAVADPLCNRDGDPGHPANCVTWDEADAF